MAAGAGGHVDLSHRLSVSDTQLWKQSAAGDDENS